MAFGGGIVNPLTAVRDRSEMAADHKGGPARGQAPGAGCRLGRQRAPG
jgi:hypothetical protein